MVQLSDALLEVLDRRATETGRSRSDLIREAIEQYYKEDIEAAIDRAIVEDAHGPYPLQAANFAVQGRPRAAWRSLEFDLARGLLDEQLSRRGVTLSSEQHRVSTERARERGLDGQVRFELRDYRSLDRRFDRIVSVGMFEHVGAARYREFFRTAAKLLKDDGVMLLHSIGRFGPPGTTNPWIAKYIFPGG